jgi:hypothetical protein
MKKFPYPLLFLLFACTGSVGESNSTIGIDVGAGGAPDPQTTSGTGGAAFGMGGSSPQNSRSSCRVSMPLRRLSDTLYRNSVAAVFGSGITASALFPRTELTVSQSGFSLEANANSINTLGLGKMYDAAEDTALAVTAKLATLLPCASTQANEACAKSFIEKYAPLAFRRPTTASDTDSLLSVFKSATGVDAFADGIALVVEAILQSPSFLYLFEVGSTRSSNGIELSPHELASRLSYLTIGAPPDLALRAAADNGTLLNADVLNSQIQRLLALPEAKTVVSTFAREWLHLSNSAIESHSAPEFTPALATSMQKEFDLFVQDAFLSQAGTMASLLSSKRTFANSLLMPIYGMPASAGSSFSPVSIDGQPRSGILTLPAVMSALSHQNETSYVFRGVFVRKRLLCEDFPAPPANAQNMAPTIPANATHAERSQLISAQATCGGCHRLLDAVGLAFDRFDEIGRYRSSDSNGKSIAANGSLVDSASDVQGNFKDVAELGQRLAASDTASDCMALTMFRNAHSRLESDEDNCFIDELKTAMKSSQGNLRNLIVRLATSDSFRYRSLSQGETP